MLDGKQVAVVVPAYNEEILIIKTITRIPTFVDNIIIVDDASTDKTVQVIEKKILRSGMEVIKHETNQGVGGAIVTGYARSLKIGADVTAVMAGDAQMDPADLKALLNPIINNKADYAKGDRLSFPNVFNLMPLSRFIGNHGLSILTRLTSGYTQVRDSQCGYTAISKTALDHLDLNALYTKYGFPNDILAHLHSNGASLAQVVVRPIYGEEVSGISLFTAFFKVPFVLIRSFWQRKRRRSAAKRKIVKQMRQI